MGRAYSAYGGEVHSGFYWGKLRGGNRWEEPDVDWRIILKEIFKK
jgi:hypothetical protein